MPPKILIKREVESSPLILMDLSEATAAEKAEVTRRLGLKTNHSKYPLVALGLLPIDAAGRFFLTKQGERVFSAIQPPVSEETIEALAVAWLNQVAAALAESPASPAET